MAFKSLPVKPAIKYEDLEKVDIRIGTIEKVEDIEGSDKLPNGFFYHENYIDHIFMYKNL